MKVPIVRPEFCKDCEDFGTCPFPDLMTFLKDLVHQKFHGNIIIPFKDGKPGKVKKEEIVDITDHKREI